jgi:hypothetical protein
MIKLLHECGILRYPQFFAPDDAGGSGGGSTSNPQGQAGGSNGGPKGEEKSPFDDLPWDELDDATKEHLEKAKEQFVATLQRTKRLEVDLGRTTELQRRFQSEFDRLKAELEKARGGPQPEKDDYLESVKVELKKAGYPDAEVDKMAPVFAGMFKSLTQIQKKELGHDLAPMAATVLGREAEAAFYTAMHSDPLGMFQENEVAQRVWDMVQERTKAGEQTNPAIAANLAKIAWADFQAAKKTNPNPPAPTEPPSFNFPGMRTGLAIPGGGAAPSFTPPPDPNAAKTTLNSDTEAALATTFKQMGSDTGVYPKKFQPAAKGARR